MRPPFYVRTTPGITCPAANSQHIPMYTGFFLTVGCRLQTVAFFVDCGLIDPKGSRAGQTKQTRRP